MIYTLKHTVNKFKVHICGNLTLTEMPSNNLLTLELQIKVSATLVQTTLKKKLLNVSKNKVFLNGTNFLDDTFHGVCKN